jgi:hypothetical protein
MNPFSAVVARLAKFNRASRTAPRARLALEPLDTRCLPSGGLISSSAVEPLDAFHRHPGVVASETVAPAATAEPKVVAGHVKFYDTQATSPPEENTPSVVSAGGTYAVRFYKQD